MSASAVDVVVIGGGPGGYAAASDCASHGLRTVLVERDHLGGTCLNVGCIPSKAFIHVAERYAALGGDDLTRLGLACERRAIDLAATMRWKDDVVLRLRQGVSSSVSGAGVRVVVGSARIIDGKTVEVAASDGPATISAGNVVIATGSRPAELIGLPFGGPVMSSTDALSLTQVPRSLVVVGGGYIGLELGAAFAKLGAKVTIVEATDRVLPQYAASLARPVLRQLARLDVEVMLGCLAQRLSDDGQRLVVHTHDGRQQELDAERVLVAVGRVPSTAGFGLERLDLKMAGSSIWIDERCQTSMRGVYAIGDVTGEPMLAHRATAQASVVADVIAGLPRRWDVRAMPAVCFTDPEILSVGMSADDAQREDIDATVGTFPFRANGRALTLGQEDGFVEVVARSDDRVLLGVHAVGPGVAELSAAASLAIEMGATLDDIEMTVHAHPTISEALHDAARRAHRTATRIG